jgi:hypothetical protein
MRGRLVSKKQFKVEIIFKDKHMEEHVCDEVQITEQQEKFLKLDNENGKDFLCINNDLIERFLVKEETINE